MELNKKEKYIKTVLENADYKLDTDLLWDSIESRVQKPDRDRRWLWFLSGVGSLAILLILTFPLTKDFLLAQAKMEHSQHSEALTVDKNMAPLENKQATTTFVERQKEKETIPTHESDTQKIKIANQTEINKRNQEPNRWAENQANIKNNSKTTVDEIYNSNSIPELKNSKTVAASKKENRKPESEATLISAVEIQEKEVGHSSLTQVKSEIIKPAELLNPAVMLPGLSVRELIKIKHNVVTPPLTKVHRPMRWKAFVAVRGGTNKVKSESSIVLSDTKLQASVFDKESGLYGYSVDILGGIKNNRGWYFMSGIDLSHTAVRYENQESVQSSSIGQGVESIYTDRQGNVTHTPGQVNEVVITNFNQRLYRRHTAVGLQLTIGKELLQIRNFGVSAELGLQYNLVTHHSGYYFEDKSYGIKQISANEDHPYSGSSGLGYRAGVNINYHINKITLSLHSFLKYNPGSITKADYFYHNTNQQLGLQLGIAYQWDRTLF